MFAWWGRVVVKLRWLVLVASLGLLVFGAWWGTGVFGSLAGGGFEDPASPSARAQSRITQEMGRQGQDVLALYSSATATIDESSVADPIRSALNRVRGRAEVLEVKSYYDNGAPTLVSTDRHATYAVIQLRDGDPDEKMVDLEAIRPLLSAGGGVQTEIGGLYGFLHDANRQVETDVIRAELISLPIVLVLLILIFRGLVAAATPLMVGVLAILGALTVTRGLTTITDVSVFAANVITMLGLGMSIDYALFVVSRFREELAAGQSTAAAVSRTMTTAGRTVAVSGLTVTLALSSLLLFPMNFLKSMGYGGMAAVAVAMVAALTALPALLAVLGRGIDALRLPLPRRLRASSAVDGRGAWATVAHSVMRRPVLYLVAVSAVLLGLASPFLRAEFGGFDERVLPVGTPSRTVAELIAADFPGGSTAPILALVSGAPTEVAAGFAQRAAAVPGATGAAVIAANGSSSLVAVTYRGEATSTEARRVVEAVRALPAPPGAQVLVGGRSASDLDQINSLGNRLPWMALYVGVVTFVLLFIAFGSVVLPVKAILMNLVSIGASLGVVVWVFQDGHLSSWLGFSPTGFLEPTNLILMIAFLFGLSTDYEVFLLSRVREEWLHTRDNTEAVAVGLQRTGGIITAAALLLIVVIGGFATGGTTSIKMLGVGSVVAVAVDAVLVRTLLVPATMRLLGRWNWWPSPGRSQPPQRAQAPVSTGVAG